MSVRALRNYVARDLLHPLEFRGTSTRYPRRELLRLLKLLQMKSEIRGKVVLANLKRRLDTLSDPDLEAWVANQSLSPELTRALGMETKSGAAYPRSAVENAALARVARETWQRIPLLPGLDLMLRADASLAAQGIAERLYAEVVGLPAH